MIMRWISEVPSKMVKLSDVHNVNGNRILTRQIQVEPGSGSGGPEVFVRRSGSGGPEVLSGRSGRTGQARAIGSADPRGSHVRQSGICGHPRRSLPIVQLAATALGCSVAARLASPSPVPTRTNSGGCERNGAD